MQQFCKSTLQFIIKLNIKLLWHSNPINRHSGSYSPVSVGPNEEAVLPCPAQEKQCSHFPSGVWWWHKPAPPPKRARWSLPTTNSGSHEIFFRNEDILRQRKTRNPFPHVTLKGQCLGRCLNRKKLWHKKWWNFREERITEWVNMNTTFFLMSFWRQFYSLACWSSRLYSLIFECWTSLVYPE